PYDVVFCDAPCSGAGTWRRTPDAKWRLTADRLVALMQSQDEVLAGAAPLVKQGGVLAYATCSVLHDENSGAIDRFLQRNTGWVKSEQYQLLPDLNGDGFFFSLLRHK
ncbi:RsmB/NOP family class I SAM-dependent RNA methyltransferase, partial [Yoonia sp.]|nr:RsmB/NOP family class I SAM-dependent RNA methyltransferase [Yoonia sp.]